MRMLTELAILLTTDSFVAFNMVSIDNNFILGYQAIAIIGAYIVICAIIILAKLFLFVRDKLRRMLAMRRYVKQRKEISEKLAATRAIRRKSMRR